MTVTKNQELMFLNAATEASKAHKIGTKYSVLKTSHKCPCYRESKLIAEVLETQENGYHFEIDVQCPICEEKLVLKM